MNFGVSDFGGHDNSGGRVLGEGGNSGGRLRDGEGGCGRPLRGLREANIGVWEPKNPVFS